MNKIILILLLIPQYIYSQVGDCPADFVCTGGNFTAATDVIDELNSSNNGCLAVNEGTTSYWYQICTSTAGTIQFTISPSGANNDYDWAVWNGSNCPPTTMPIRCSFAISMAGAGGDNTGVNSANNAPQTDNSEGAGGNQWTQDIVATAGQCYTICINNYGTGSDNFSLTFGGTATLSCTPLPIELYKFECESTTKGINLEWTTISETDNQEFQIWRSIDGIDYSRIATVPGKGTTNITQFYKYSDFKPFSGVNYYKLVQKDYQGKESVLNVKYCYYEVIDPNSVKYYNMVGQIVDFQHSPNGVYIKSYKSGNKTITERILKYE